MLTDDPFEKVWDGLLSRQPERILSTFAALDESSRAEVLRHLRLMVGEAGWHPEQVKSARAALKALRNFA